MVVLPWLTLLYLTTVLHGQYWLLSGNCNHYTLFYNTIMHKQVYMLQIRSTFVLQGVELPKADEASTVQHMDSLKQDVHDRDEEIRRLTSLLQTKEEMAEGRGGGGERGGGEVELSDVKAMLEEEKDRRLRSEEELKNLQVCGTWLS